ncbi:hypothetical protein SAMN04487761_10232 [Lachnospiraceae bacterium C7]|nr:hypothetical protein SAMN04487761_10232 [Lachnospiraceae bacterium C7]
MLEVYVLIEKAKTLPQKVITGITAVIFALLFLLALMSPVFVLAVIVIGIVLYLQLFKSYREYEYSYFDGEVRFALIKNKSKRKKLKGYTMDEVIQIAPAHDRTVMKYENTSDIVKKDFTSRKKGVPYYDMVVKTEDGLVLIMFEPDEKYLNAVNVKYRSKVIMAS